MHQGPEYQDRRRDDVGGHVVQDDQRVPQKQENCAIVKGQIVSLEAGGRQARVDAKGERYFADEAQTQVELAKARQQAGALCN